jgi:hypothetical protein
MSLSIHCTEWTGSVYRLRDIHMIIGIAISNFMGGIKKKKKKIEANLLRVHKLHIMHVLCGKNERALRSAVSAIEFTSGQKKQPWPTQRS